MPKTTATRCDVRHFGDYVVMGLGAVATVGVLVATIMLAAAWIVNTVVATNPVVHASATMGPGALTLVQDAPNFANAPAVTFDDRWPRTTASMQASAMPLLPQQTQVAQLTPAVAPISAPDSAPPLPPKRPSERANSVPLPRPHPAQHDIALAAVGPIGSQTEPQVAAATPSLPPASAVEKRAAPQEAHNKQIALPDADSRTAVYDISARTVYLPNGQKLEAHSGLGDKLDDPRYVKVRMRGPTPPNVYDLTLREELFHGVRAIRLNPVDDDKMFGRAGMLAHTYMLGANGQSNGCVSFRNYDKFLQAYLKGEVDRLVVVAHRGSAPARVAHERRGHAERYAANN